MPRKPINIKDSNGNFRSLRERSSESDSITGRSSATKSYDCGKQLYEQGKYHEAILQFQQALERTFHYKTYERIGMCYMALNDPGKAIEPLLAATSLNRQIGAPYLCAEAFVALGEFTYADMLLELVLSREPRHRKSLKLKQRLEEEKVI